MRQSIFKQCLVVFACLSITATAAALARMLQGFPGQGNLPHGIGTEQNSRVINVRELGARGDGVSDDTLAIQKAIDTAVAGATIRFPAGVYLVSNLQIINRSGLVFAGEGRRSVIKQKAGAERIANFDGPSDIVITQLGFDANGIKSYGGVVFYAAERVRIENNWFWDSARKPVETSDRYSIVFGKGRAPSQDLQIVNNVIDDLQLEVNHARRVVIEGNTINRAVKTAGIGIFTVGNDAVAEDYQIVNNKVVDPIGAGISVGVDPPTDRHCSFRRITIANNQILRSRTAGYGIRIGTPDNSKPSDGNRFEDLQIKNNQIRVDTTAPAPAPMIFANASARAGILFETLAVSGNNLENEGPRGMEFAVDLRRVQNSLIGDNRIKGFANGIALGGALLSNQVRNNVVEATQVAYAMEDSLGGNRAVNNQIVGKAKTAWKTSTLKASDLIER